MIRGDHDVESEVVIVGRFPSSSEAVSLSNMKGMVSAVFAGVLLSGAAAAQQSVCKPGFVWREAGPDDYVCVTPAERDRARDENRLASSRIDKGSKQRYCQKGYVWREAYAGDKVCVTAKRREDVKLENASARARTAGVTSKGNSVSRPSPSAQLPERSLPPPRPIVPRPGPPGGETLDDAAEYRRTREVVCISGPSTFVALRDRTVMDGVSIRQPSQFLEIAQSPVDKNRNSADGLQPGSCAFMDGMPPWLAAADYFFLDMLYYNTNQNRIPVSELNLVVNPAGRGGMMVDDGRVAPSWFTIGLINALGNPQDTSPTYIRLKPTPCNDVYDCRESEQRYGVSTISFLVEAVRKTPFTD